MEHLGTRRIETERLILRRFTEEDVDDIYRNWASDPEVTRYLQWKPHATAAHTGSILREWISSYNNVEKYVWCIAKKENNEPIGSIDAFGYNEKVQSMEIGYCIGKAYWHQGIASEALRAVMDYLLHEVGIRRIEARHDVRSPYAGAVMRKCGMQYEGMRRQADWNNSGICDSALYGYVKDAADMQKTAVHHAQRHVISDETIEYVGILAKLALSDREKEQAKKDMEEMLTYVDQLNELDTEGIEPLTHIFPVQNVFREDIVTNGDGSAETLLNAPEQKDGGFKVPRTIG